MKTTKVARFDSYSDHLLYYLSGLSRAHFFPATFLEIAVERFHSRGQRLCKFVGTKESVYIRKEFNSHWIVLEHQYGCREDM